MQGALWGWQYCGVAASHLLTHPAHRPGPRRGGARWASAVLVALLLHAAVLNAWNRPSERAQRLGTPNAMSVRWLVAAQADATASSAAEVAAAGAQAPGAAAAASLNGGSVAGVVRSSPSRVTATRRAPPHGAFAAARQTAHTLVAPPQRAVGAVVLEGPTPPPSVSLDPAQLASASPPVPPTQRAVAPAQAATARLPAAAEVPEDADETLATAMPSPAGIEVPTYRPTWAPATTLQYRVRRDAAQGQVELTWRPVAEQGRYELALRSHSWVGARGAPLKDPPMQWASRGQFDGAGLAPERFTVARRGRDRYAANFQRDKGLVSYAGPAATWPLAAGMQDRLSWMLQLGAILQAQPDLALPGQQVQMWVVGAHGDAAVWTFAVSSSTSAVDAAPAAEQTASASLAPLAGTVLLQREATHPYDTQVQIWLDPAQHHLPVRVVFKQRASGQSTELWLRTLQAP